MGGKRAINDATLRLTQKIQLHFPRNISKENLEAWNNVWFEVMTEKLQEVFSKMPEISEKSLASKFYIAKKFYITIPLDYDPNNYLNEFAKYYEDTFCEYSHNINEQKEYSNPSHELIPGKTYKVIIWGIKKGAIATDPECLRFLLNNKTLLTGALGLAVVYQYAKNRLMYEKWLLSYDKENKLWRDRGNIMIPCIWRVSLQSYYFQTHVANNFVSEHSCLLGFYDCEPESLAS